jgi:hypothetical protein
MEGCHEATCVGECEGANVGLDESSTDGCPEISADGLLEGRFVGLKLGS